MKVLNSLEFQGASFAEGAQLSEKEMLHIIGGQQSESYAESNYFGYCPTYNSKCGR